MTMHEPEHELACDESEVPVGTHSHAAPCVKRRMGGILVENVIVGKSGPHSKHLCRARCCYMCGLTLSHGGPPQRGGYPIGLPALYTLAHVFRLTAGDSSIDWGRQP